MICLKPSILFLEYPKKYWYFFPILLLGYLVDLVVANTSFRAVAGRGPRSGERTVSDMLDNLCLDQSHPDRLLFLEIGKKINRYVGVIHIKNAI